MIFDTNLVIHHIRRNRRLPGQVVIPNKLSSRNMGKNDLWIAATALYFDFPLHTTDNDFDHLPAYGLRLVKQ